MSLKKYRKLLLGIAIGLLCILPVGVLAAGTSAWVSALLDGDVAFLFDGQRETLPAGYAVLFYDNRTYVPVRFVAEQLGASVSWDQFAKTVKIDTKPGAEELVLEKEKQALEKELKGQEEKIKSLEKEIKELKLKEGIKEGSTKGQPAANYQKIPINRVLTSMNIGVTGLFKDDYYTRVYLELENKKTVPLQLQQIETKAIVDGVAYKTRDIMHFTLDQVWYHDVAHEEIESGYVMLPRLPEDAKEMYLELTILYNDAAQKTETVEFAIKLE